MTLQKNKPLHSKVLRNSARGEDCTLILSQCRNRTETVILAHSDFIEHGKGIGLKGSDDEAMYCCFECHSAWHLLDIPEEERRELYERAKTRTHGRMRDKGLGHILDKGAI